MAVPYPNQLPPDRATPYGFEQIRGRMLDNIDSVWRSVFGSRRTMADAREAMARADEVLARRLSDSQRRWPIARLNRLK